MLQAILLIGVLVTAIIGASIIIRNTACKNCINKKHCEDMERCGHQNLCEQYNALFDERYKHFN